MQTADNLVNLDIIANGCYFEIGGEVYRKDSDKVYSNAKTGELLYDASLFGYKNNSVVMVKFLGRKNPNDANN